jgi:hypothetical protein
MTAWFFPAVGNVSIGAQKETAAIPTSLPFFIRKRKKRERKESVRRTKDLAFLLLLTGISYAINMSRV